MNPERWQQVKSILHSALELDPRERAALLDEACAANPSLRGEVESLIASYDQAAGFIESPAVEFMADSMGDQTDSLVGQSFGPYQILERIGIGGMGEVYLAQDSRLGRRVALKMLPEYFTKDDERVRRFQQEARAASALNHPNILTIYEIGQVDSRHFIATEFIEGETLRQSMIKRELKLGAALDVATQVASALSAAHQAGITHRDIKPENIMLRPDGVVKVLDFGLAKLTEQKGDDLEAATLVNTKQGILMGTAHYMSPEQARGQKVDARTDLFSLGAMLYEMVAGHVPFEGETMTDVLASILRVDPAALDQSSPETPAEVQRIVDKALRKDKVERYQTAKELLSDLKDLKQRLEFEIELERSVQPHSRNRSAAVTERPSQSIDDLNAGRSALEAGAWQQAEHAFERALAIEETPESLEGLGLAAWWLDLADVVFNSRERAYRAYRSRGDQVAAARMAIWIAWDSAAFRGEEGVANGWLQRARRLLEGQPDSAEHAFLAERAAVFVLLDDGNPEEAEVLAAEAIRVGQAIGAIDHEMVGRALHGFARVTTGRVTEGMRELDEVSAAILAGELSDRLLIGLAGCYLIGACDRVRDHQRAVQWCERIKEHSRKWGLKPLFAVCRTQYASVCMWRGAWDEAERELTDACEELAICRPGMTTDGLARLGELRRRQGRFEEAASLFDRSGAHPIALLGRAAMALDQGDPRRAAELAERYLRRLPAKNRTERAAALELLIRVQAGPGHTHDPDRARAALDELQSIAADAQTPPLLASASLATGLMALAAGDLDVARRTLEDAVDLFEKSGAPFEVARARIDLACVMARLGRTDTAIAEVNRALEALTQLDARHEVSAAQALRERLASPQPGPGAAATRAEPTTPATSSVEYVVSRIKHHRRGVAATLIILILLVEGSAYYFYFARGSKTSIDSIAVLPFHNTSGDPNAEYLSDGISEALINSLTELQQLRVIARSTAFRYKGKEVDPQAVGRELNVRAVLMGWVRQVGNALNIQVDLVDATTGAQLWGGEYERKVSDVLSVKQTIAQEIIEKLRLRLSTSDQQRLVRRETTNSEAYPFYLRGRYYWNKRAAEGIKKALEEFQQAVDKDPAFALAYTGLADCYTLLEEYSGTPARETLPKARAAASRALEINNSLAEAHTSLGLINMYSWEFEDAEKEFKRGIELNPNYPTAHHWYSIYLRARGRLDESMTEIKRAQQLDPLSPVISDNVVAVQSLKGDHNSVIEGSKKIIDLDPSYARVHTNLGWAYLQQRREQEAIAELQKAVAMSRRASFELGYLGYGYAALGKRAEAGSVLRELEEKYARHESVGKDLAMVYAGLEENDHAFAWLEKDFQARTSRLFHIGIFPTYERLWGDPRYTDLLRRMGLRP